MTENWHALPWQEVLKTLGSDFEQGLSEDEVAERRKKTGLNVLPEEKPLPKLKILLWQFKSPLIYILLLAGIVVLAFAKFYDAIVIFGVVVLNTAVGFWQENKATTALRKLKKIVKIEAEVIREGHQKKIDAKDLVIGDIVALSSGNKVPADLRLIESYGLKLREAPLTGEWLAADKKVSILAKKTPLADRDNMAYMGCLVEDGKGKGVAVGLGSHSELGNIAGIIKETKEEKTPLQKKLAKLSRLIALVVTLISIFILLGGLLKHRDFIEMFETAVAVAVAAIPEGLPVALTVILALGMERILKKKGLVRRLVAAETLGNTSIIATDKTLTLTEGKMEIAETSTFKSQIAGDAKKEWPETFGAKKDNDQILLIKIAALCNEAFIENPEDLYPLWQVRGRPTDRALLLAAAQVGLRKPELEKGSPKLQEIPFKPQNKFIARLCQVPKGKRNILYVSGAPEKILALSNSLHFQGRKRKMTKVHEALLSKELKDLTRGGLRVVAMAYKELAADKIPEQIQNLAFVGFIGLKDPIRKEAKEAIQLCRQAGMKPILVTGDHLLTARAVAKEIGLSTKGGKVVLGSELDEMSDEVLQKKLKDIEVYARVEPRHKLRIVGAWQEKGEVVAMTGDGINDAPALKKADIGVALGSGTDVAKDVSDLVLLTDNFNIIVAAVEEGRAIFDNIRKVITYLLSDSFTEIILIGIGLFLGWPLAVSAVQILWVNLIEDGPLALCLAFEPKEKDVIKQKPQGNDIPLLTKEMKTLIFVIGLITDFFLLGLFFWLRQYSGYGISHIRSIIFAGLTIDSIFYIFSCKSLRRNLWHINPFSNKFLVFTWIFAVIALIAALYLPAFQTLLKTVPLSFFDWQLVLGLGLLNISLIEITKWYFITRKKEIV